MVREHPVFGVGPGMVKPLYASYAPPDAVRTRPPHLHSNVVQLAAERGLVGLGAYVLILISFFFSSWRLLESADPDRRAATAGCLVAIVGLTVAGLFEYNWGDAEIWIPTLVCLSTPIALAREEAS
jgi:O-antigen ligase